MVTVILRGWVMHCLCVRGQSLWLRVSGGVHGGGAVVGAKQ